jgi:hypothetical protein
MQLLALRRDIARGAGAFTRSRFDRCIAATANSLDDATIRFLNGFSNGKPA